MTAIKPLALHEKYEGTAHCQPLHNESAWDTALMDCAPIDVAPAPWPEVVCSATGATPVSVRVSAVNTAREPVTVNRMSAGGLPALGPGAPAMLEGAAATVASRSCRPPASRYTYSKAGPKTADHHTLSNGSMRPKANRLHAGSTPSTIVSERSSSSKSADTLQLHSSAHASGDNTT